MCTGTGLFPLVHRTGATGQADMYRFLISCTLNRSNRTNRYVQVSYLWYTEQEQKDKQMCTGFLSLVHLTGVTGETDVYTFLTSSTLNRKEQQDKQMCTGFLPLIH